MTYPPFAYEDDDEPQRRTRNTGEDAIAKAVAAGRLAPYEVDLVRRLMRIEKADEGTVTWVPASILELPAGRAAGPRPIAASAPVDETRHRDESVAEWAARTGRIMPSEIDHWQDQIDNEKRIMASAGRSTGANEIEDLLRILTPGLRGVQAAAAFATANSDTPMIDDFDRRMAYPGSPDWERFGKERERAQDLAAEASYRAQLEAEAEREANGLTDEEFEALFEPPFSRPR